MVVAFWANLEVFVHFFAVDNLLAIVTLNPEPFGDFDFFLRVSREAPVAFLF